jgi:ABC-2 type transport system ATP-binding protein
MLLQTDHLTKSYNGFLALSDLNLTVAPGEVFGLLGPNGSGKTTALRLILGFLRPSSGMATINGHDCWQDGVAARRFVCYLPGELRLYENMTGREITDFLGKLRGDARRADVDALARRFDIDLDRPLAQLSSGMKRKVALLQVLVPHTPLLILDEPTNALDPTMRDELLVQLREARSQGQAVLFSSHVLAEVQQVCDRVGILQKGRLVHLQEMKELRQSRLIHARFPNATSLPELPGLTLLEQHDGQVVWQHDGPLPPLLQWLSQQTILDLRIESVGLGAIYHRYHGAAE